jgi:hypothetical protein
MNSETWNIWRRTLKSETRVKHLGNSQLSITKLTDYCNRFWNKKKDDSNIIALGGAIRRNATLDTYLVVRGPDTL